ncbi:3-oxoacyl [Danaus plexippus plexippus]|uniref:3-oxoacyl n=1 Tax=Danaus plexippus plexippus TaxID=278856 RepID=A0A212F0Z9_DANPL|nr:3-oxoacyl [Danaus plexippus plexippus]
MNFSKKVILITGAASGIGKAIALSFAKLSARLSLIDINFENLNKVAEDCEILNENKVFKVATNVSDTNNVKEAVTATVQEFDRLDVVINCAGICDMNGITGENLIENLGKVLNINLISHIAATHYAADELIKSKGCVVNISSIFGTTATKNGIPYAVSKAGMVHFTKCAALELAEKGVRNFEENTPLKHLAEAQDIAEMAVFLASDKAKHVTGIDVIIDSGITLRKMK